MLDRHPLLEQHARDQHTAVAVLWVLLGTHHREPQHLHSATKAPQAKHEVLGASDGVVANVTVLVVEILVIGSSAELATEE